MRFPINKKGGVILALCVGMVAIQSFDKADKHDRPSNLKILPKDISEEQLHHVMREYSMSLGVRCGYCHAEGAAGPDDKPHLDFASDAKPEKDVAREMMTMVDHINHKYIGKIKSDHDLEQITCVSCHMGHVKPMVSVDSLKKN